MSFAVQYSDAYLALPRWQGGGWVFTEEELAEGHRVCLCCIFLVLSHRHSERKVLGVSEKEKESAIEV